MSSIRPRTRVFRLIARGLLVTIFFVWGPGGVEAQEHYSARDIVFLDPATRIRVTTENEQTIGSYAFARQDSLGVHLRDSDQTSVFALPHVSLVEVSRGTSRGSSALTVVGALVGAAIGVAVAANEQCDPDGLYGELCAWRWFVIPATFGAGGLVVGWGLGMAFVTSEKWQAIEAGSYRHSGLSMLSAPSTSRLFVGLSLRL